MNKRNLAFYRALVELHHCDIEDEDRWLYLYRKVKRIRQVEGRGVLEGWRRFYQQYGDPALMPILEKLCWRF